MASSEGFEEFIKDVAKEIDERMDKVDRDFGLTPELGKLTTLIAMQKSINTGNKDD